MLGSDKNGARWSGRIALLVSHGSRGEHFDEMVMSLRLSLEKCMEMEVASLSTWGGGGNVVSLKEMLTVVTEQKKTAPRKSIAC